MIVFQFIFTILGLILVPFVVVSFYRAGAIHRNFRIQVCVIACIFVNATIARGIIFYYQFYDLPLNDEDQLIIVANIARNTIFGYLCGFVGSFGMERTVATIWWKWYEKGGASTVIVVVLIELSNIFPSVLVSKEWLG
ncbi:hypothetical protein PFISCL1PPCAC_20099, partial [Pristionchus fissidentatus]